MESYARGPASTIVRKSIGDVFLETAARHPDRPALIVRHEDTRLTWDDYRREALRVIR